MAAGSMQNVPHPLDPRAPNGESRPPRISIGWRSASGVIDQRRPLVRLLAITAFIEFAAVAARLDPEAMTPYAQQPQSHAELAEL